jgi:hypothetical protein
MPHILFNTQYHPTIYSSEEVDTFEPYDSTGFTIMRYTENNMSAGVGYQGANRVMTVGFPFETTVKENERDAFMKKGLEFLLKKRN